MDDTTICSGRTATGLFGTPCTRPARYSEPPASVGDRVAVDDVRPFCALHAPSRRRSRDAAKRERERVEAAAYEAKMAPKREREAARRAAHAAGPGMTCWACGNRFKYGEPYTTATARAIDPEGESHPVHISIC